MVYIFVGWSLSGDLFGSTMDTYYGIESPFPLELADSLCIDCFGCIHMSYFGPNHTTDIQF